MSTAKKSNSYRLRMLTTTAMLGAMAGLLMLILFLLWRESGDKELLIALGAFLFL